MNCFQKLKSENKIKIYLEQQDEQDIGTQDEESAAEQAPKSRELNEDCNLDVYKSKKCNREFFPILNN